MQLTFQDIERTWNSLKGQREFYEVLSKSIPELTDLRPIKVYELQTSTPEKPQIGFENISLTVSSPDSVSEIKKFLSAWIGSHFEFRKIKNSDIDKLNFLLTKKRDSKVDEAVQRTFKRVGNKVKLTYKCVGGPKDGKRVSDPSQCTKAVNLKRRQARKQAARRSAGSIAKNRIKTRFAQVVARNRTKRANQRLNRVLGRRTR